MKSLKIIFFGVLLLVFSIDVHGQSEGNVPDSVEFAALKDLYITLNGDNWTNRTGWPSSGSWPPNATHEEFGSWHGIIVTDGDVIQLNLPSNNLDGVFPSLIGTLTELKHIYLGYNKISGSIRNIIGLNNLMGLDLNHNNLTGGIPEEIGNLQTLTYLRLSNNLLKGIIPESIGNLDLLRTLGLTNCKLEGPIPDTLRNLSLLESLYLHQNSFNDSIPGFLCGMTSLVHLYIPRSGLIGNIPPCLGSLNKIESLVFEYNNLTGEIPSELGSLSNLKTFYLNNNNLHGPIPETFQNLDNLVTVSLGSNRLNGPIPEYIKNFLELKSLFLSNNNFNHIPDFNGIAHAINLNVNITNNYIAQADIDRNLNLFNSYYFTPQKYGTVPDSLELAILKNLYDSLGGDTWDDNTNWPSSLNWPDTATAESMATWHGLTFFEGDLIKIQLVANNLSGPLPKSLTKLPDLEGLSLSTNYITGNIPSEYGKFSNLLTLDLGYTLLTDSIPPELGDIETLRWLDLRNTLMEGPIPPNLGSLSQLRNLYLRQNNFTGGIPPELGNLTELVMLDLYDNPLGGAIPGSLGRLQNLQTLNLILTGVEGDIPDSLGFLSSLKALYLHQNKLTGEIPSTFCGLTSLEYFYVPQNAVTGQIPSCLGNLPKLKVFNILLTGISGIPDFTQHPAKGTLSLHCEYAALPPGEIEKNMDSLSHSYAGFSYNNQKYTGPEVFEFDAVGSLLIPSVDGGSHGNYIWEKKDVTTGAWENVDISNEDIDGNTFYKESLSPGDTGVYRFTINNTWIGSTYISSPLEIKLFSPKDLYAISSGNWEDPLMWSDSIGGHSINRTPRSVDRIYIKDQTININNDLSCKAIRLMNGTVPSSLIIEAGKVTVSEQIEIEETCSGCEVKLSGNGSISVGEL